MTTYFCKTRINHLHFYYFWEGFTKNLKVVKQKTIFYSIETLIQSMLIIYSFLTDKVRDKSISSVDHRSLSGDRLFENITWRSFLITELKGN
jgi:hypothetical protein